MALMFGSVTKICSFCYKCGLLSPFSKSLLPSVIRRKGVLRCSKVAACSLAYCSSIKEDVVKKLQIPEKRLTHEQLIKQACTLTVDSASQLLVQTVVAAIDINQQYRDAIDLMLTLMEENLLMASNGAYQEDLWDEIISSRALVEDNKKTLLEVNSFIEYVMKMATSAAETSFLAGAEYSSTTMCERINSAMDLLAVERDKTKVLESQYLKMQETFINKVSDWENKIKKKSKTSDKKKPELVEHKLSDEPELLSDS